MALRRSRQRQHNSNVLTRVLLAPAVLLLSGVPGDVTYLIVIFNVPMLTKMVYHSLLLSDHAIQNQVLVVSAVFLSPKLELFRIE